MNITGSDIAYGIAVLSVIFSVYNYFRNPQIRTDKENVKLSEEIATLKRDIGTMQMNFDKQIVEIKTNHLANMEKDIKDLTGSIGTLNIAMAKLSTIIDERIPRAQTPQS
jgi:hypothetical protein